MHVPTSWAGSSPLARGLLALRHGSHALRGIIPARAGFTYNDIWPMVVGAGSSPLARGLHFRAPRRRPCNRIIPARAGFTSPIRPAGAGCRDHPRSRGVYVDCYHCHELLVGSSPLARGLLVPVRHPQHPTRIIPARAGFTCWLDRESRRLPDHPRSRGVYVTSRPCMTVSSGSSPLARGLRSGIPLGRAQQWIIPARAGFTPSAQPPRMQRRDHPRSRGVYWSDASLYPDGGGSSPLARGLLLLLIFSLRSVRIIPARAGFTERHPRTWRCRADHPRSRGVYRYDIRSPHPASGSSPLARGLPISSPDVVLRIGIIPARAGFTPSGRQPSSSAWDHPRSRGVYNVKHRTTQRDQGSSPLARGLPSSFPFPRFRVGIIPARAGFTLRNSLNASDGSDHPRSRGVYRRLSRSRVFVSGSSPLARGLLRSVQRIPQPRRIIPARAGFTSVMAPPRPTNRDHPRSRGVYRISNVLFCCDCGSSPLARGLLTRRTRRRPVSRIIPARAGFTVIPSPHTRIRQDHPRSRGVYLAARDHSVCKSGSSPLARGLPPRISDHAGVTGIIPARAGFTPTSADFSGIHQDHPRSRGVYADSGVRRGYDGGSSPLARGLHRE